MRNSRVQKAIDSAIARSKTHTKYRRAFSRDLVELGARQTKQKLAVEMLRKAGVDFERSAKEAAKDNETFKSALREMYRDVKREPHKRKLPSTIYNTVPPPGDATPQIPFCIFPADDCSCSPPDNSGLSCDASKAEMTLLWGSTGVGGLLGIEATPWIPPATGSLWYGIQPPIGGTLAVIAAVLVNGFLSVKGETFSDLLDLLPSISADACATLFVRTHQQGGTGTQASSQVIGEAHCGGGGRGGHSWVDDVFVNILYAQVLPDIPVVIEVSIELEVQGRSTYGSADIELVDIRGIPDGPGVIVSALCLNLTPTVIL